MVLLISSWAIINKVESSRNIASRKALKPARNKVFGGGQRGDPYPSRGILSTSNSTPSRARTKISLTKGTGIGVCGSNCGFNAIRSSCRFFSSLGLLRSSALVLPPQEEWREATENRRVYKRVARRGGAYKRPPDGAHSSKSLATQINRAKERKIEKKIIL